MAKLVILNKAHVRAYDRHDSKTGETIHVDEYNNKVQARLTNADIMQGLRGYLSHVRAITEELSRPMAFRAPQQEQQPARPQSAPQKRPTPSSSSAPPVSVSHSQAVSAPSATPAPPPPKIFTDALLRLENGAPINDVMLDFARRRMYEQHLFDKWLVLSGHDAQHMPGSVATRFHHVAQETHKQLKAKKAAETQAAKLPSTSSAFTESPGAAVRAVADQRETETREFAGKANAYPEGSSFVIPVASQRSMVGTWKRVKVGGESFWQKGSQYKKTEEFIAHKESILKQLAEPAKKKTPVSKKSVLTVPVKKEEARSTEEHAPLVTTFTPPHVGHQDTTYTDSGGKIGVQYAVVEADKPIASHDTDFTPNPDFPPELQPRDRSKAASESQIQGILAHFQPELLGKNPKTSEGAPLLGPDGVIEIGNGRTIAMRRAYEGDREEARLYREWLTDKAGDFGLEAEHVRGMKRPLLVKMRQTAVNRRELVEKTNKPAVLTYSPAEQAKSDARFLTASVMESFNQASADGVMAAENRDFARHFVGNLDKTEIGDTVTSSGSLSQKGAARIKNALFYRAYKDTGLMEKVSEETESSIKTMTNAMAGVAPRIAALRAHMEAGTLHRVDIVDDMVMAVKRYDDLKKRGASIKEYLANQDLLSSDLSVEGKRFLAALDEHHSAGAVRGMLIGYADFIERAGNPQQGSLLGGDPVPTKRQATDAALAAMEKRAAEEDKNKLSLVASWVTYARDALRKAFGRRGENA